MTELTKRLTTAEADVLADCEQTISHGLQTFVEVGTALSLIRDNRLYRGTHQTFEDYCRERWNLSRPRAYELMTAAEVVSGMPDTDRPTNARQAVELARVPAEERAEVWQAANDATDGKPTAAAIRAAATPDSPTVSNTSSAFELRRSGPGEREPVQESGPASLGEAETVEGTPSGAPSRDSTSPAGERIPDMTPEEAIAEWRRRFHERADGVRAGRETYASFVADFPPEHMDVCAGPDEHAVLAEMHDPAAFAEALDRLVPDPNPHREWQRRFLDAISGVHRVMRFTPEDVAECADEQCIDELVRVFEQFDDYRTRVIEARISSLPNNVTPMRRTS